MPKRNQTHTGSNTSNLYETTAALVCILLCVLMSQVQSLNQQGRERRRCPTQEPYLTGRPFPCRAWSASTPSCQTPPPAPPETASLCRGWPWFEEMRHMVHQWFPWTLPPPALLLLIHPNITNELFFFFLRKRFSTGWLPYLGSYKVLLFITLFLKFYF